MNAKKSKNFKFKNQKISKWKNFKFKNQEISKSKNFKQENQEISKSKIRKFQNEYGHYMMNKGDERIMYDMQDLGKLDGLDEDVEKRTKDKDEIIEDFRMENKRLNDVIINLHKDIGKYNRKVKMQDHIIDTQQDIINALVELVSLINDKE